MRRAAIGVGAGVAMFVSGPAAADARPLEPTTAWRVNYSNERCSLSQQYGTGRDAIVLQIDSNGSWEEFEFTLAGPGVPRSTGPAGVGAVRFSGDPGGREARLRRGVETGSGDAAVSFETRFVPYAEYERHHRLSEKEQYADAQPDRTYPDYEQTIAGIVVAFNSTTAVQLNVHAMAGPLAALRTCVDGLIKAWGGDPDVQKNLTRAATLDEGDVVRLQHAYPPAMLRKEASALVPVRLMLDSMGKVTSCVVQAPVPDAAIKTAICGNLVHFKPAIDAAGKPVATAYATTVAFLIPG